MDKRVAVTENFKKDGLLPLFFHKDAGVSVQVLHALYAAGSRILEYTNRGEAALANFKILKSICETELPGMLLGAGTIKDSADANAFIDAGADFIISPGISDDIYDTTYGSKVLWVPGCMTPSEIMKAEQFGLDHVKLFPGIQLGPAFVTAVKEVFPKMNFLPTGGVDTDKANLKTWFDSGVVAVGLGSRLLTKQAIEAGNYGQITENTRTVLGNIKEIR